MQSRQQASGAAWPRSLPRGWRLAIALLAGLLLLLALLGWWLSASFDVERFKRVAADWTRTQLGRELVFDGAVELQLLPRVAVSVERVSLSQVGQPQQRFAAVERAELALRLVPLLRQRRIEIDRIAAQGLQLRLQRDAAGRSNADDLLERFAGRGAGGSAPAPQIDELELRDLQLELADDFTGVHGRLVVAQLDLGGFAPEVSAPLRLQARAELQQPPLAAALELQAGLRLSAATSALPGAAAGAVPRLQLDRVQLQLRGEGFGLAELDARLQAAAVRVGQPGGPVRGAGQAELLELTLAFSGRYHEWRVEHGELSLARLVQDGETQRSLQLRELALQLRGRLGQRRGDVSLRGASLTLQGDQLQGGPLEAALQLAGEQQLRLRAPAIAGSVERISVPGLAFELDGRTATAALGGRGEGALVLEPRALAAVLEPVALQLQLDAAGRAPLALALDGQLRLTPALVAGEGAAAIAGQRVDTRFELRVDGARPRLELHGRANELDLDRIWPARSSDPAAAARTGAPAALDFELLRVADASVELQVARLRRAPYRVDALELQAGIADGVLDLRRAAGRSWGGSFVASGRADAREQRVALQLRAQQIDLRALLADTLGHDGVSGRGRIDADLNARGADLGALRRGLGGTLRVALRPAALRGVDLPQALRRWREAAASGSERIDAGTTRQTEFQQLDASFVLRNGVARNDDLDAHGEFLRISGEGTIDLVRNRLDYALRARVQNTASGRAGPEMTMLNGVTVPVQLSGPFGGIQWQVDWPVVTAAVAARSLPNAARGAAGAAARGATGLVRGAAGLLQALPGAAASAPR